MGSSTKMTRAVQVTRTTPSDLITMDMYLGTFPKRYRNEYSVDIFNSATDLLARVNALLKDLFPDRTEYHVNSGWRPREYNRSVGGAGRSWHIVGKAVDIADDGTIDAHLLINPSLLSKHGLWLEHPNYTPGWTHLDTGDRLPREVQIFRPT